MYTAFGTTEHRAAGSTFHGGVTWIYNRWHEVGREGHWLVTLWYKGFGKNFNAVMDDFGDLCLLWE